MININETSRYILSQLKKRLMQARLARNESQEVFSARIGLTRQTYSKKMENAKKCRNYLLFLQVTVNDEVAKQ